MATYDQGLVNFYTTQFSTNVELLLQQRQSKLRGLVMEGGYAGKMASPVNQIGAVSMRAPQGRFAPMPRVDVDKVRRWVTPSDRELPLMIDSFDELKTIVDPKSQYAEAAAAAVGRFWDDTLIAAALGTAQVGQDASALTSETFDTTNFQIASTFAASSTSTGLTVAKIIEAKRILRHNHVDLEAEPITLVIGSQQESDLLNQVQVVSTEFNSRPIFDGNGTVTKFLGFNIVFSERLNTTTDNSTTCRQVIAFAKTGLHLGIWKDVTSRADQRVDMSGIPWQLYTQVSAGATRTQSGKVISILCKDSTGPDITP